MEDQTKRLEEFNTKLAALQKEYGFALDVTHTLQVKDMRTVEEPKVEEKTEKKDK